MYESVFHVEHSKELKLCIEFVSENELDDTAIEELKERVIDQIDVLPGVFMKLKFHAPFKLVTEKATIIYTRYDDEGDLYRLLSKINKTF